MIKYRITDEHGTSTHYFESNFVLQPDNYINIGVYDYLITAVTLNLRDSIVELKIEEI